MTARPGAPVPVHTRSAVVERYGEPPVVRPVPIRQPQQGETLLKVIAAPLNPLDLAMASGDHFSLRPALPYVPGVECTGSVLASARHPAGAVAYAELHPSRERPGAFAGHVIVADDDVLLLPPDTDPVTAACLGNAGIAAYTALALQGRLQAGETVLILGATGALGQIAVQVARRLGARRVIAAGRSAESLRRTLELGADATVQLSDNFGAGEAQLGAVTQRIKDAAGGELDVVLDGVYGTALLAAMHCCRAGARIVNVASPSQPDVALPAALLRGRQLSITSFAGALTPLHAKAQALHWLLRQTRDGLQVAAELFGPDDIGAYWARQGLSPHHKLVWIPAADRRSAGVPRALAPSIRQGLPTGVCSRMKVPLTCFELGG